MTNLSQVTNVQTMSSLEIAELTGKQHKNILADIRKMLTELEEEPAEILTGDKNQQFKFQSAYLDAKGEPRVCFQLPKRECLILVSGYNVKMRAAIIDRWQELETESLMEMIDRLAITQCSFKREQPHFVYLISDGDYIKIGVTNDIDQRVQSLQTGNPTQLTIITCIPCENARYIEGMLHGVFEDSVMQGEWFNLSESQIKIAIEKINKYRIKTD